MHENKVEILSDGGLDAAQRLVTSLAPRYQRQPDIPPLVYVRGCPCDGCEQYQACQQSGYECREFKVWVSGGKRHATGSAESI